LGLQVVAASAVLAVFLLWAGGRYSWLEAGQAGSRVLAVAAVVSGAVVVYFGVLLLSGLNLRQFVRR
jgi:putative peptidoglycan lipid II flippase